jgi:hypothetical protein
VAILTPILLSKSAFGAYFLFGFLALGTVVVLAAYMPETRGRSLESIQEAFQRPPILNSWAHHLRKFSSKLSPRGQTMSSSVSLELSAIVSEGQVGSISIEADIGIARGMA